MNIRRAGCFSLITLSILAVAGSIALTVLPANDAPALPIASEQTKARMDKIFAALVQVLPRSLNGADYEKQANREAIQSQLKILSEEATQLEGHAVGGDRTFAFLASSLARDARDIYRWYSRGSYGESRYLLHNFTENCVACHSRLPANKTFPAAEAFFKDVKIANLPLVERAQLQMATRQFDAALQTYEELFSSASSRVSEIIMMDGFLDYLKVAIRVKQDVNRPIPVLEKMLKRQDLPQFASVQIQQWIASLKKLSKRKDAPGTELVAARKIINEAQRSSDFRMDRGKMVDYIYASRLLNEYIQRKEPGGPVEGKPRPDLSEAYYLLGVTESMTGRSYWLSQTEFYLETAVRYAPRSRFAEKAYALLEEQVVVEFSGSAGTNVPDDMQKTLDDLRRLMKH